MEVPRRVETEPMRRSPLNDRVKRDIAHTHLMPAAAQAIQSGDQVPFEQVDSNRILKRSSNAFFFTESLRYAKPTYVTRARKQTFLSNE